MSAHKDHRIHKNSAESNRLTDKATRRDQVLSVYRTLGASTDREVAEGLGFPEMNQVRPTITTLLDEGLLIECGSTHCFTTDRTVRLCCIPQGGVATPRAKQYPVTSEVIELRVLVKAAYVEGYFQGARFERGYRATADDLKKSWDESNTKTKLGDDPQQEGTR